MTVNELIQAFNDFGMTGEEEVCVYAFGGMRGGKSIASVSKGFDWDHGKVILHPQHQLRLMEKSPTPDQLAPAKG